MVRRVKQKDHEKLDDITINKVIELLERTDKPITKKEACSILNISYNTKRLDTILANHKQKAQIKKERFAKNRGRPWDSDETKELVVDYLNGESISGLSASLYRSPGAIKKQLAKCGVPLRNTESSYHKPELLPDDLVKEELPDGSLAWSARYCCVVEIRKLFQVHKEHGNVYDIWIFGKHNEQGCQPWYELAELPILNDVGATANDFIPSREDW